MSEPTPPQDEGQDATYEPPTVEDLQAGDGAAVTAAGGTVAPGAE